MDYLTNDTDLTAVADAIREKGGTSAALSWPQGYVAAIGAISGGGGGSSERFITPSIPQYAMDNCYIKLANYNYATIRMVGDVGGVMRISTNNHYYLSSLTNAETGDAVPYTTVSEGSRGGEYTFTMPDADVTYKLYYND